MLLLTNWLYGITLIAACAGWVAGSPEQLSLAAETGRGMVEAYKHSIEVEGVFRRTSEVADSKKTGGYSTISEIIFTGLVANDGSFRLKRSDSGSPNPEWNGKELVKWPPAQLTYTSDGKNALVYRSEPKAAFVGSAVGNRRGVVADVMEQTSLLINWLSGSKLYSPGTGLEFVSEVGDGDKRVITIRERVSARGVAISYSVIPAMNFLITRLAVADIKTGSLVASMDMSDPFEIGAHEWRARLVVTSTYKMTIEDGGLKGVLSDAKPIVASRQRLEILAADVRDREISDFVLATPREAQFVYRVLPNGENVQIAGPGFRAGGAE